MNDNGNEHDNSLPGESSPGEQKLTVPFEDSAKDFFQGFFETIKLVLFQPTEFFRNYKLDGSMGRPILFAVIIGWVTALISMFWESLISRSIFTILTEYLPDVEGVDWSKFAATEGRWDYIIAMIFVPVGIIIGLFIMAGLYHVFLLLVKGANKNFETTFNVVAYSAASSIAEIIPFCGGLISWIYGLVLAIIGLNEAHKTDSWKATFAVLAPLILCCICCALFIMLLVSTGYWASFSENMAWN